MNNLFFIWQTFLKDLKIAMSYRAQFFLSFISIFFSFYFLILFSKLFVNDENIMLKNYGGDYFVFLFFGVIVAEITNTLLNAMPNTVRNYQTTGILEELMINGRSETLVITSSLIFPTFRLIWRIILYLVLFSYFSNSGELLINVGWQSIVALILFIFAIVGISLLGTSLSIVLKGSAAIPQLYLLISSVLCGVAFPLEILPNFLRFLSEFLPTTHFLLIFRNDLINSDFLELNNRLLMLSFLSIIIFSIGIYSLKKAINYSKRNGSLLFY